MIQSTHKVLGSLTQSAMLHVSGRALIVPRSATRTKIRIRSSVTFDLSIFRHNPIRSALIPDRTGRA